MNTSVLHHKQRRYHYYRCRSNAGGRPPCKGVSVQAYQFEWLVCEQLSALKPEKLRHPGRRQFIADFAPLWAQLDDREQMRALGDVVQEVDFDPDGGKLRLTIQAGAPGAIAGILTNRVQEAR